MSVGRTYCQVLSCCMSGCRTVEKGTEHSRVCSESLKLEMILSCLYINNLSIPVKIFFFLFLNGLVTLCDFAVEGGTYNQSLK